MKGKALIREDGVPFGPLEFLGAVPGPTDIPDWLNNRDQQLMTLQSDIDVWAEGVAPDVQRRLHGHVHQCRGLLEKIKQGMGENQNAHALPTGGLGLDKPTADDLVDGTAFLATWRS